MSKFFTLDTPNEVEIGVADATVVPKAKTGFFERVSPLPEGDINPPTTAESLEAVVKTSDFGEYFLTPDSEYRNPLTPSFKLPAEILSEENTAGIPMNLWHKLLDAVDEDDVQAIRNKIFEDQKLLDNYQRSGWAYTAMSFGLGVFSPWNIIPMASSVKYAKLSSTILQTVAKNSPSIIGSSVGASLTSMQAHAAKDADDFYNEVLLQSAFGLGITGLVGGLFHGKQGSIPTKGYQAIKTSLDANIQGAELKVKINEKGEFDGYQMKRGDSSLSAAKMSEMQGTVENGIDVLKDSKLFKYTFGLAPTPIIRGLNSSYNSYANFTDLLWDHSFITKRMVREGAIVKAENIRDSIKNRGTYSEWEARNIWEVALSEQVGGVGLLESREASAKAAGFPSFQKACEEAFWPAIGDDRIASSHPVVNKIAEMVRKKVYDPLDKMLKDREIISKDAKPRNTALYMNTVWDKDPINANPHGFHAALMKDFGDGDTAIATYTKPYIDAKKAYGSARKDYLEFLSEYESDLINTSNPNNRLFSMLEEREAAMLEAQKIAKEARKIIQTQVDNGEIPEHLLRGRPELNRADTEQLVAMSKPFKKIQKQIKAVQKQIDAADEKFKKALKSKSTTPEMMAEKKRLNKKIDDLNAELNKAHEELGKKYADGKLNPDLVRFDRMGRLTPIKLKTKNWFRKLIGSKANQLAVRTIDRILGETPEQMSASQLKGIVQGGSNPFKERMLLVDYRGFDGFIVKDVVKLAKLYTNTVSKRVAMHDMARQFGGTTEKGYGIFYESLKTEHNTKMNKIDLMKVSDEKKQKLRTDQRKELKKVEAGIDYQIDLFLENYGKGPNGVAQVSNRIKQYSVMAHLGGMAIASISTVAGPLMKANTAEFIQNGIIPLLTNYKRLMKEGKLGMKDMADCNIGISSATNAYWESVSGINPNTSSVSRPGKAADYLSSKFGNMTFMNQFNDMQQIASWNTNAHKIERLCKDVTDGIQLSKRDKEYLQLLGIEPGDMTKAITQEIKVHGTTWESPSGKIKEPNFSSWDNFEAAETMKAALGKVVRMTISQPHAMDIPETLRNPIVSCFVQFKSWLLGATTNYLLTSMQRPDAQKLIGLTSMYLLGTMVDPIRQMSRGEEPSFEMQDLINSGIYNSGILGWPGDAIGTILASMDLDALDKFRSDKFRRRSLAGALGGPVIGDLENIFRGIEMVFNGTTNQADLKRLKRAMIYNNIIGVNYLLNKGIEETPYPETRAQAERQGR